jgi:hypothetical protein
MAVAPGDLDEFETQPIPLIGGSSHSSRPVRSGGRWAAPRCAEVAPRNAAPGLRLLLNLRIQGYRAPAHIPRRNLLAT